MQLFQSRHNVLSDPRARKTCSLQINILMIANGIRERFEAVQMHRQGADAQSVLAINRKFLSSRAFGGQNSELLSVQVSHPQDGIMWICLAVPSTRHPADHQHTVNDAEAQVGIFGSRRRPSFLGRSTGTTHGIQAMLNNSAIHEETMDYLEIPDRGMPPS